MDVTNENFGFHSAHWMLQVIVSKANPEDLRVGVIEMINYLVHNDDPEICEAFEILVQYSGAGVYYPTRPATEEEAQAEAAIMDPTRRDAALDAPGPADISQMVADFKEALDKMPTAEEPKTNEEEND